VTYTHIVALADRSGSMGRIHEEVEGSFDAFIAEQRKLTSELSDTVTVTLWQFDDTQQEHASIKLVYAHIPLSDVPPMRIVGRGMTPLYDALGVAITDTGTKLANVPQDERPDNVIFVVMTDGQENASKEYNSAQVREMVTHQRDVYKWDFHFIGVGIDAWDTSRNLGFAQQNTYSVAKAAAGQTYSAVADSVTRTRRGSSN
jgi:von Willebrand factor type A domain-containing protein